MLTVYALPGGGASVEIERESSLPGVGRVAAGWRKRPATLTMRRVRSFSSLARWNEPPRARSAARCWQVWSQYLILHLMHRGASWASGAAQAGHVVRIIVVWRVV